MTLKTRHIIIILLLCLVFSFSKAQNNLILNSGFEDTLYCNISGSGVQCFKNWHPGTLNTTFAQHACNFNAFHPKTGYGCVGAYSYYIGTGDQLDYIAGKFSDTLETGRTYCFSFYVKLQYVFRHGSNNLGVFIDNQNIFYNTFFVAPATPKYTIPFTIIDTTYQLIQFVYTAQGGESDFMVGGYMPYASANYPLIFPGSQNDGSFFVYDDFSLSDASAPALGNDTTLCASSDSLLIGEPAWAGTKYKWYVNGVLTDTVHGQIKIKPGTKTTYVLQKENCLLSSDTLVVDYSATCPVQGEIPNVFTPNEDGQNDAWEFTLKGVTNLTYAIYNRWGNLIYQPGRKGNTTVLWDGRTTSGEKCSEGMYFYVITYTDAKGEVQKKNGCLSLFR